MIMRANILGIIDKQQKSYLFRQLSYRGYRQCEPFENEISFEGPSMIYNSIKMILDNGIINIQDFIDAIAIPQSELVSICSFPSNFIEKYLSPKRGYPHLQVVKP